MSLQSTEAECAANATAPRVSLASMEAKIACRYDFTADKAIPANAPVAESLSLLSICILVMENGFTLIGKSAPASAANFNADLGRKLAYEDAIRQLWPLEGYALRDLLMQMEGTKA
jgi:Phage protein (N4 Gp49/phage Sf6 gene 66) family